MHLSAQNLDLRYFDGDQEVVALDDITLEVPNRSVTGIMGPSGSGKSSLLYLLSGLKRPTSGAVMLGGQAITSMRDADVLTLRRRHFGFVFQQPYLLNYLTARENLLVAAAPGQEDANERANELLDGLGIHHLADRYPTHMSGGERQRIVVARAMINRPSIIFADEPTAALDQTNGHAVIDMLMRYRAEGAVLIVTHDAAMVSSADRIIHLLDGRIDDVLMQEQSRV